MLEAVFEPACELVELAVAHTSARWGVEFGRGWGRGWGWSAKDARAIVLGEAKGVRVGEGKGEEEEGREGVRASAKKAPSAGPASPLSRWTRERRRRRNVQGRPLGAAEASNGG